MFPKATVLLLLPNKFTLLPPETTVLRIHRGEGATSATWASLTCSPVVSTTFTEHRWQNRGNAVNTSISPAVVPAWAAGMLMGVQSRPETTMFGRVAALFCLADFCRREWVCSNIFQSNHFVWRDCLRSCALRWWLATYRKLGTWVCHVRASINKMKLKAHR